MTEVKTNEIRTDLQQRSTCPELPFAAPRPDPCRRPEPPPNAGNDTFPDSPRHVDRGQRHPLVNGGFEEGLRAAEPRGRRPEPSAAGPPRQSQ